MLPDEKIKCHRAGFKVSCFDGVTKHKCQLWRCLQGAHPQTGEMLNKWSCVDALMDVLLIDILRHQAGTQKATESMRNEIVDRMDRPRVVHPVSDQIQVENTNGHLAIEDQS